MGKLIELDLALKDLRTVAATINDVADTLAEIFNTTSDDGAHVAVAPTERVLKLEAVRAVLADKSRAGFTAQIRSLLQKYGADKLSGIDPANYKALLADVEGLDNAT